MDQPGMSGGVATGDGHARWEDLPTEAAPSLPWSYGQEEQSLDAIFQSVQHEAIDAIEWYRAARAPQKRWARWLRGGSVLCAVLAGIIPILSEILRKESWNFTMSPAWATVALAVAAGLQALDRFFGCSTAWIRYSLVETKLQKLLRTFQADWELASALRAQGPQAKHDLESQLRLARRFVVDVQNLVQRETETWRDEFQSTLRQLDDSTQGRLPTLGTEGTQPPGAPPPAPPQPPAAELALADLDVSRPAAPPRPPPAPKVRVKRKLRAKPAAHHVPTATTPAPAPNPTTDGGTGPVH